MLAKKYRFHSRGGVKYTYQKGRTLRGPNISLIYAKNTRNHQRFTVVVSKKVEKTAVGRNRLRRRVYEAIRLNLPNFPDKKDCIFVVYNKEIADLEFTELTQLIATLLNRTRV